MVPRQEYLSKSKTLQEQLKDLKSEIQVLKVEDRVSTLDRLHDDNIHKGDKYATLRKVTSIGIRGVRSGLKVGQKGTKWDKCGAF